MRLRSRRRRLQRSRPRAARRRRHRARSRSGLRAAHIGGPFIVVGHSSGGLYVRVFAALRPRDVVGLVLVDPSVPYQDRRMAERFGPGAGSLQGLIDRASRCLAAARSGALPSIDRP